MSDSIEAEAIAALLVDRGVAPDAEFTAHVGRSGGWANAWRLPNSVWLVRFGNGGGCECRVVDALPPLHEFLIDRDLDLEDHVKRLAELFGIAEADETPRPKHYVMLVEEELYPFRINVDWARDSDGAQIKFKTRDSANRWLFYYIRDHSRTPGLASINHLVIPIGE